MDNGQCKKSGIRCVLPFIAVFLTILAFEMLFHGAFMKESYEATASLWRSSEEMMNLWWVCISTKLVIAAVATCLFCCVAKGCESGGKCYKKGAKFGAKIGLLLGAQQFASYAWLPIDINMAANWLIGNVVMGILIGLVLTAVTRCCKKAA